MAKFKDITGVKFHMLTPVERVKSTKSKRYSWLCKCDCGNTTILMSSSLVSGNTKSCGCFKINAPKLRTTHGKTGERLYQIWIDMKSRCANPKNKSFNHYGGRGISICEEWLNSVDSFYKWAYENGYEDHLTIERNDVNGNYEPSNCSWIPLSEQVRNTRRSLKNRVKAT